MPRQSSVQGSAVVLLAESLALPAGFAVVVVLTRALGPDSYGRYSIAATVIVTLEWVLIALLSRPTVKFVADAPDWKPVAATSFRLFVALGLALGAGVWLAAVPMARLLNDPQLAGLIRLFALEIPIFGAASACRSVLAGRAHYREQAAAGAGRWLGRLLFIMLFVWLGWHVNGAILGNIAGVAIAFVLGQAFVGRAVLGPAGFPGRELFRLAVPTFVLTLSVGLFDGVGILALRALGGSSMEVGYYGAAQNLLVLGGVVSRSITPILVSSIAASRRSADGAQARRAATLVLRCGLWMFPLTAILSGAAPEVVELLFGRAFEDAASLVAVIVIGASGLIVTAIALAILIALGRPWPAVALTAPLLPLSVIGHALLVPRLGAIGAALVTTATSLVAAMLCTGVVCAIWPLRLPLATAAKSAAISVLAYGAAAAWPADGPWLIVKLSALSLGVAATAVSLREFSGRDIAWLWSARRSSR